MSDDENDHLTAQFSVEVGSRLRTVRKAKGMSLDDVERRSGGRWSASAIGAYERGFRNLSLPRLRELAAFYAVPMGVLLGEEDALVIERPQRIVLDLERLSSVPEAEPLRRYLTSIIHERGDWNGRVLTVRRDDIRALCAVLHMDETVLFDKLRHWHVLLSE